jgi:prophage regulatory protein
MVTQIQSPPTILRRKQVEARVGLRRSTIYQRVAEGTFPAPVNLGGRAVGWVAAEVERWIADRPHAPRRCEGGK